LHARAILGLPIPAIKQLGASASSVVLVSGESDDVQFSGFDKALAEPDTQLRLFGKPDLSGRRRMGVALALDETVEAAVEKAKRASAAVTVTL
jgi:phosphoribosylglycinamide formyltransferase 2